MERLFGQLALKRGFITAEQLAEATRVQARAGDGRRLGQVLIELGHLDFHQLDALLEAQRRQAESARVVRVTPLRAQTARNRVTGAAGEPSIEPLGARVMKPAGRRRKRAGLLQTCLREAASLGASDVHVQLGSPPRMRLDGRLVSFGQVAIDAEGLRRQLDALLSDDERAGLAEAGRLDTTLNHERARLRLSAHAVLGGLTVAIRFLPAEPPSLDTLGLPTALSRFTNLDRGLVLLAGPAGSGRSSTLAALVHLINQERTAHVVTLEAQIEHLHPLARALLSQRAVGDRAPAALRAALREDPDVVVVDVRDEPETCALTLRAAEEGHLVLATLTARSAPAALERFEHLCLRGGTRAAGDRLADVLEAVVMQRLVPTARDDGRVPAIGWVEGSPAVARCIRAGDLDGLTEDDDDASLHMRVDDRLAHLVRTGMITRAEAARHADEPERFAGGRAA